MKHVLVIPALALLAGCYTVEDANQKIALDYKVGEELMTACYQRNERCSEYRLFKRDFEARTAFPTTFEKELARYKKLEAEGKV